MTFVQSSVLMSRIILATGNAHKVEEFQSFLSGTQMECFSANNYGGMPEVEETGTTFRENALIKAEALRRFLIDSKCLSGGEIPCVLSDDSGLEVDSLQGAPGVYSARYAGVGASDQDNLNKLLKALAKVPELERTARFRCVLCLIKEDGLPKYFEGTCDGRILKQPQGISGFGYDPVFAPDGYSDSFAQLGALIKARLSHRAKAMASFVGQQS